MKLNFKSLLHKSSILLTTLGLSSLASIGYASNFSYSQIHLQAGYANYDKPIVVSHNQGSDNYKNLPFINLGISYQNPTGIIFSASTTQAKNKTNYSQLTTQGHSAKIGYAFGVFEVSDLYVMLGQYWNQAKACDKQQCQTGNDQNQGIDLGGRTWIGKRTELAANYRVNGIFDDKNVNSFTLQTAYWLTRHSQLTLGLNTQSERLAAVAGLRFSF